MTDTLKISEPLDLEMPPAGVFGGREPSPLVKAIRNIPAGKAITIEGEGLLKRKIQVRASDLARKMGDGRKYRVAELEGGKIGIWHVAAPAKKAEKSTDDLIGDEAPAKAERKVTKTNP